MKKGLVFTFGVLTGILLTIAILVVVGKGLESSQQENFNVAEQKTPFTVADSFEVFQVLEGGALANCKEKEYGSMTSYNGPIVFLVADGQNQFFDNQIVTTPLGKSAVQVGTYKYATRSGVDRTVPVITFEEVITMPK